MHHPPVAAENHSPHPNPVAAVAPMPAIKEMLIKGILPVISSQKQKCGFNQRFLK